MASTYLTKTSTTVTNDKKFTVSAWVKGSDLGGSVQAGVCGHRSTTNNGNNSFQFGVFNGGYYAAFVSNSGNDVHINKVTNRLLRDVHAWYHLVIAVDSTLGTASDRVKMYINGELQTSFSTDVNPPQDRTFLNNSCNIDVGRLTYTDGTFKYWDGAITHFHFVDGTAYPASTFGETDATTGIWKPIVSPTVTYGNNGFFLKMDNSANMGLDSSGQSNNLTTSGTIIQNKDTPSNVFNNLSSIDIPTNSSGSSGTLPTLSNASSSITNTNSAFREIRSNIYVTKGKYYFEAKPTRIGGSGAFQVGVVLRNYSSGSGERRAYQNNGNKYTPGSTSYGASFTANDIIGVALNLTDGEITFYKNGVSQGVAATDMLSGMDNVGWTASASCYDADAHFNFGNGYFGTTAVSSAQNPDDGIGIFEYDVPAGYKAICTKSLNAQEYS